MATLLHLVGTLLAAVGLVFVAELGDKSQLAGVALAARYRPILVFVGLVAAALVLHGVAVTLGAAVAAAVPERAVRFAAGALLVGFALAVLRQRDEVVHLQRARGGRSAVIAAFGTVLVAEMGDKTQLAVATFGATHDPLATWTGAVIGMALADGLAIMAGARLWNRLPPRVVRWLAATAFAGAAVAVLLGVW